MEKFPTYQPEQGPSLSDTFYEWCIRFENLDKENIESTLNHIESPFAGLLKCWDAIDAHNNDKVTDGTLPWEKETKKIFSNYLRNFDFTNYKMWLETPCSFQELISVARSLHSFRMLTISYFKDQSIGEFESFINTMTEVILKKLRTVVFEEELDNAVFNSYDAFSVIGIFFNQKIKNNSYLPSDLYPVLSEVISRMSPDVLDILIYEYPSLGLTIYNGADKLGISPEIFDKKINAYLNTTKISSIDYEIPKFYFLSQESEGQLFKKFYASFKEMYKISDSIIKELFIIFNQDLTLRDWNNKRVYYRYGSESSLLEYYKAREENFEKIRTYFYKITKECGPGSIQKLYDNFGIIEGGRYGIDVLKEQLANIDNKQPFYAIMYPRVDDNHAFYNSETRVVEPIINFAHKKGAQVRIYEVASKEDIVKFMLRIYKNFPSNSILGGIIGGHGSNLGIRLGIRDSITTEDLDNISEEMKKVFKKTISSDAEFVLKSCSTGFDVARKISEGLSVTTLGPHVDAFIRPIDGDFEKIVDMFEYAKSSTEQQVGSSAYKNGTLEFTVIPPSNSE